MRIIGIDPGTKESAFVFLEGGKPVLFGKHNNETILYETVPMLAWPKNTVFLAIEMIQSFGMAVGQSVFETCRWIGRFEQAFPGETRLVYRKDIKLHFCGSPRAKDANVRQALIDKYGPIGTKKAPGPLYGIHGDEWQALSVALYASEVIYANQVCCAPPDPGMRPKEPPLSEVRQVSPPSKSGMLPGRD